MAQLEKTLNALTHNGITNTFFETKDAVVPALRELIAPGAVVASGGSMTLKECGVMELLRSGDYEYLDRSAPGLSRDAIEEIYRRSFFSDVYLMSANAITENGELYNVDGNSNRVAALLYGPRRVIVIAGINKIVPDLPAAIARVKTIAAPKNCVRLNCDTPCFHTGQCVSHSRPDSLMADGCGGNDRVCCNYVVSAKQRKPGRIHVLLVNETLGF